MDTIKIGKIIIAEGLNVEECRSFLFLSAEMEVIADRVKNTAGKPEVVDSAKELVTQTRTIDGVLERLSSGVRGERFAEQRTVCKGCVHGLLKQVKDAQTQGRTPQVVGELEAAVAKLKECLNAVQGLITAPPATAAKTAPAAAKQPPKSPRGPSVEKAEKGAGTIRWESLQKKAQELAKEEAAAAAVVAPPPLSKQSGASRSAGEIRQISSNPNPAPTPAAATPADTPAADTPPPVTPSPTAAPDRLSKKLESGTQEFDDERKKTSPPARLPSLKSTPAVTRKEDHMSASSPAKIEPLSPTTKLKLEQISSKDDLSSSQQGKVSPRMPFKLGSSRSGQVQALIQAGANQSRDSMRDVNVQDLNEERKTKLLQQAVAKCRWLEDELYQSSEVRVVMRLAQAQNLMPVDPNGKSDPYCIVNGLQTSQGQKIKTKVVREELDPVWDETFEFELPSQTWNFRIDLMDWDSDTKSKPLGYVEMRSIDWKLSSKEQKKWLSVQDGTGTLYVGLRSAVHVGLQRAKGDQYWCHCCQCMDIPDIWACEKCGKNTCALCLGQFICDVCREDICRRKKTQQLAVKAEEPVEEISAQNSELRNAQRAATLIDVGEWSMERFKWPAWTVLTDQQAPPEDGNPMIVLPKNYGVEFGSTKVQPITKVLDLTMLDPFETYPHYTNHLIKCDHSIFIGEVKESSTPVLLVVEKLSYNSSSESNLLRCLVYSPDGTLRQKLRVDSFDLKDGAVSMVSNAGKKVAVNAGGGGELLAYLRSTYPGLTLQRIPTANQVDFTCKLLEYERNHTDLKRRIGVLFFPKGVREENAVFKSTGSPDLYEFMDMLGERVRLQGWEKYAGGLNTKNNSTGFESYYTEFLGFNIMFHVNSLLEDDGSEQQLSRKRFIGNDLVVFIFLEGAEPFDASMITSQMCHTFIVVRKISAKPTRYRVSVVAKPGVPAFSPYLPAPSDFEKSDKLRQFLLAKALNANRATFQAKTFLQKTKRTRKDLLARLLKDLNDEGVLTNVPTLSFAADADPLSPLHFSTEAMILRAVTDFIAEDPTFVSFRAGDLILAVSAGRLDVNWVGVIGGRVGRFPSDRVELVSSDKPKKSLTAMLHRSKTNTNMGSASLTTSSTGVVGPMATFRLRFIQGRNMSICDPWGTSDPYCTVSGISDLSGKPIRTRVQNRTLNPEWNQHFDFQNSNPFTLRIEIWDKDMVGEDDSMGYVDIISKDWNLAKGGEQDVRWLDVVDGDGQIRIGLQRLE